MKFFLKNKWIKLEIIMFLFILLTYNFHLCCLKKDHQSFKSKKIEDIVEKVKRAYEEEGFSIKKNSLGATVLYNKKNKRMLQTGGGFHDTDIKLFLTIAEAMPVKSIFIIGNAFGYSTFCLSEIFKEALIDVIDAEVEGDDNKKGSEITRTIAKKHYPNVRLTIGFSPQDTPKAVHPEIKALGGYDLVFIDGLHTDEQIIKDFDGIVPFLASKCVVAIHDVGLCKMYKGFMSIRKKAEAIGFDNFIGRVKWTKFGTGLAIRSVDKLMFYMK